MKKGLIFIVTLACAGLFLTAGLLTAADIPVDIVIDGETYSKDRKGAVNFSHAKHSGDYGVACVDCHHDYVDGKNIWEKGNDVKKCEECHDPSKSVEKVKKLMLAFHKNCQNCHKAKVKEGIKAPGKKCINCHIEDKKS